MIDPSLLEQYCLRQVLRPLGEYVARVGMQKPLAEYTKDEVLLLIDAVVTAYQTCLIDNQHNADQEVPF